MTGPDRERGQPSGTTPSFGDEAVGARDPSPDGAPNGPGNAARDAEVERFRTAFPEALLTDAEARLLAAVEADLARVLGAGVAIEVVERPSDGSVRLVAVCLVEGRIGEIEAVGSDLRAAAQSLVRAAAGRRLEGAFWRIIGPPG